MADPGLAISPELKVEICGNMNDYSISYKIQNANTGTPSTKPSAPDVSEDVCFWVKIKYEPLS